jgi:hypothetical protein
MNESLYEHPMWAVVDAMVDACDGYADDENVMFEGVRWNVANLRAESDFIAEGIMRHVYN